MGELQHDRAQVSRPEEGKLKKLIYAVEDDESIGELYACALNSGEFSCEVFARPSDFFSALSERACDLILLDVMLPEQDGMEILSALKSGAHADVPVIMVSAKGSEVDKVKGLNLGANDYLAKPFGILELEARIRANLRKSNPAVSEGEFSVDFDRYSISVNGNPLDLTNKEYNLLKLLILNRSRVMKRETLLNEVWGYDSMCETRTLDIHIKTLRQKIAQYTDREYIHTVRSVGYRFE